MTKQYPLLKPGLPWFMNDRVAQTAQQRAETPSRAERLRQLLWNNNEGSSLVELAVCLPVLLLIVTGIFSFGVGINNYLELTNAVSIGARNLAVSRTYSDPCGSTAQLVAQSAPFLDSTKLTYTFNFNGATYTGNSCSTSSSAAASNLVAGTPATLTVTYPIKLAVYGKTFAPFNLVAQTTELVQ